MGGTMTEYWYSNTKIALNFLLEDDKIIGISFVKQDNPLLIQQKRVSTTLTREINAQFDAYFEGKLCDFDLPYTLHGTPFQLSVWQALCEIPYGTTATYTAIAGKIGKPLAIRAVGNANHNNPIPIIVPCHRVIGTNGKLTGYAGGLDIKQLLLNIEQGLIA